MNDRSSLCGILAVAGMLFFCLFRCGIAHSAETPAASASLQLIPATAAAGEPMELRLVLTVNDPWYVYGHMPGDGGQKPLNLRLKLPAGVKAVDGWQWPENNAILNAGQHVFRQKLQIDSVTEGMRVTVRLAYQACNAQLCLPVEMIELSTKLR